MIIIGDIHGGYPEVLYKIKRYKLTDTSFIQVGDWGLGFQQPAMDIKALSQIDDFLISGNNRLYILRGNHDNKWFWDNRAQIPLQQITLVQDYELITIDNRNVFFAGGGISIDRMGRTLGQDHWHDEAVYLDEPLLQLACSRGIDVAVTHIAPNEAWPYTMDQLVQYYIEREQIAGKDLLADLISERRIMSTILSKVRAAGCREWYYGHYHASHVEEKDGISFRCMNIQEIYDAG